MITKAALVIEGLTWISEEHFLDPVGSAENLSYAPLTLENLNGVDPEQEIGRLSFRFCFPILPSFLSY